MQGDLRNMKDVQAAVAGADCVWHAAWNQTQTIHGTGIFT